MDKKKLEFILAVVLIVILIALMPGILKKNKKKIRRSSTQTRSVSVLTQEADPLFKAKRKAAENDDVKDKAWGRDPFVLEEVSEGGADSIANLRLMGVIGVGTDKARAIINNEFVTTGSTIGRFTVLKITKSSVTVTDGKESFELEMQ